MGVGCVFTESGNAGSSLLPVLLRGWGGGVEILCEKREEDEEDRLIGAGEGAGSGGLAKASLLGDNGMGGTGGTGRGEG